jgi:hypothetical protein
MSLTRNTVVAMSSKLARPAVLARITTPPAAEQRPAAAATG